MTTLSPHEAVLRLREGNARFVASVRRREPLSVIVPEGRLRDPQTPHAVVLGCSDSRIPVELVLGQGLGDLFVIRVAGNVVQPSQIGSVEFAVERFGTRLVVVMGHSECGAVTATVEELLRPTLVRTPSLRVIVDLIRPAVEPLVEGFRSDPVALVQHAVRANIAASIEALQQGSPMLREMMSDGLGIVGAEYEIGTGVVTFLDGAELPS